MKKWGVPNFQGAKIDLKHDLVITNWEKYRTVLSQPNIIELLRFGFPSGHEHILLPEPAPRNHASATNYAEHVEKYLATEIRYGAITGPYIARPFEWTMRSALMTRPKSNSQDRRVIMDLSFPPHRSVNDGIPKDIYLNVPFKLLLPSALTLRDKIRVTGENTYLWSKDLRRGYRQLRGCPLDYPLMGIEWDSRWYVDLAIPFGCRNGAKFMQETTNAVVDIMKSKNHYALAYIDDLAGADIEEEKARTAFEDCGSLLRELGLMEAEDKQAAPSKRMVWLGVTFDTIKMEMSIPRNKINNVLQMVHWWQDRKEVTKTQLQSLLGKLFFISTCSQTLRLFTNRILETYREQHQGTNITLTEPLRKDLEWIARFLPAYNGRDIIPRAPDHQDTLLIDSCLSGGGGHLGNQWYKIVYPPQIMEKQYHISALEMLNAMIALKVFRKHLEGHCILIKCDNTAAVSVLETGKGRCPTLLSVAREAWKVTAKHNITVQVTHIPGKENCLADLLSRAHLSATNSQKTKRLGNKR